MADTFAVAHCHLPHQHCNLFFVWGRFCQKVKFKINKNGDFGGFQLQNFEKKERKTIAKFIYLVFIVELEM